METLFKFPPDHACLSWSDVRIKHPRRMWCVFSSICALGPVGLCISVLILLEADAGFRNRGRCIDTSAWDQRVSKGQMYLLARFLTSFWENSSLSTDPRCSNNCIICLLSSWSSSIRTTCMHTDTRTSAYYTRAIQSFLLYKPQLQLNMGQYVKV